MNRCPVCLQEVQSTRLRQTITAHLDGAGRAVCPMTGHPYELTVRTNR